jgi:hypothetical protein
MVTKWVSLPTTQAPLPTRRSLNNSIFPKQIQDIWVGCLIVTRNFPAFWGIIVPSSSWSSRPMYGYITLKMKLVWSFETSGNSRSKTVTSQKCESSATSRRQGCLTLRFKTTIYRNVGKFSLKDSHIAKTRVFSN